MYYRIYLIESYRIQKYSFILRLLFLHVVSCYFLRNRFIILFLHICYFVTYSTVVLYCYGSNISFLAIFYYSLVFSTICFVLFIDHKCYDRLNLIFIYICTHNYLCNYMVVYTCITVLKNIPFVLNCCKMMLGNK